MKRRTVAIAGIAVVVVVAFFVFAPVVYSPTKFYVSGSTQPYATYSNWNSLSCWAFGFGTHYGSGFYQLWCYRGPHWLAL